MFSSMGVIPLVAVTRIMSVQVVEVLILGIVSRIIIHGVDVPRPDYRVLEP